MILADTKKLQITLSNTVLDKLIEAVRQKGMSKSIIITLALEKYLEGGRYEAK